MRKPPTLRDISNCLERLESLLSYFAESSEAIIDDGGRHAEFKNQFQLRPRANVNAIEPPKWPPFRPSNRSTWEILLNNSDNEPLLQDVGLY